MAMKVFIFDTKINKCLPVLYKQIALYSNNGDFLIINEEPIKRSIIIKNYSKGIIKTNDNDIIYSNRKIYIHIDSHNNYISLFIN